MQTSRSFNWYTRMWRAWITQPFNSTVTYGQLNMLHLKSVGESLVVPYGGSNIFFMIFLKIRVLHLFLKKYDCNTAMLLNFLLISITGGFISFLGKSLKWTLKSLLESQNIVRRFYFLTHLLLKWLVLLWSAEKEKIIPEMLWQSHGPYFTSNL